jgi:hypothetical protein
MALESSAQEKGVDMRADAANADRCEAVRGAAAAWQRTAWIDEETRIRIDARYPDDRVRAGRVFRILFFILTACALQGGLAIAYPLMGSAVRIGPVALVGGLLCVAVTEYLLGPKKRRQGGIEPAFSLVAIAQLMLAVAVLVNSAPTGFENRLAIDLCLFGALAMAAAWRWGYSFYAVGGCVMLLAAATRLPWARLFWTVVPLTLFAPLLASCDSPRLPPVLRRCAAVVLATLAVAFYTAINVYCLDRRFLESGLWSSHGSQSALPRNVSILLTALVPPALLILGIRTRRRLLLNLGIVFVAASLITLRFYSHVAPLWLALCAGGGALLAASVMARSYLASGAGKERGGFTAEPLLDNPANRRTFEMLASVAAMTPHPRSTPPEAGFQGEGGKFGGGGASGEF